MGGLLQRSRILNRVWLSPEQADIRQMIKISRRMEKSGYSCLNMTFHSTSLLAGYSPFILNKVEEGEFFQKIEKFLVYAQSAGWISRNLAEFQADTACHSS